MYIFTKTGVGSKYSDRLNIWY